MSSQTASAETRQRAHLERLEAAYANILATQGFDAVLIYSGHAGVHFADDQETSFKSYGHFVHWTGASHHQHDWLLIQPGSMPRWYYYAPADFWHLSTPAPTGVLAQMMTLEPLRDTGWPPPRQISARRPARCGRLGGHRSPAGSWRHPYRGQRDHHYRWSRQPDPGQTRRRGLSSPWQARS